MQRKPPSRQPRIWLLPMLLPLALCACLPRPQVVLAVPPPHCRDQIPDSLKADVPGVAPPSMPPPMTANAPGNAETWAGVIARGWMGAAVGTAAQLAIANAGKRTILEIYEKCEQREAEIAKALMPRKKFLGIF